MTSSADIGGCHSDHKGPVPQILRGAAVRRGELDVEEKGSQSEGPVFFGNLSAVGSLQTGSRLLDLTFLLHTAEG